MRIKPTDALNSNFIGVTTLHVSWDLRRTSALLTFLQLWLFATRSRMELQFHPTPGSKRSSQLHKVYQSWCTAKNSWWWAERLPETCRVVIPIKLEFSASVGFIRRESVTMHGHTIVKTKVRTVDVSCEIQTGNFRKHVRGITARAKFVCIFFWGGGGVANVPAFSAG
jgi:hypothetical protein